MSFESVPDAFARALAARGYVTPTPVQQAVLDPAAEGRDLLVSAQTGSGKTVAYGLAMADALQPGETLPPADAPLALIVAPTRELALQVQAELRWLYAGLHAVVGSCVGGMDPFRERKSLERGVHIVVGTPGRLRDHLERGALRLDAVRVAVLDEADEMLDLGFHDDLEFLLQATPAERRTLLFSATLPKPIVALARNYQRDSMRIEIAAAPGGHADIEYRAIRVAHAKVDRAVINLLRFLDPPSALVFCATRAGVQKLGETLAARGFASVALSGEMSQNERNRALSALRDGRAKVCVATDVAARGLDVPNLALVIQADLPNDAEVMQHRSGRTGRAGKKGVSILLIPPSRRRNAETMLQRAGVHYIWEDPPSRDAIAEADRQRLLQSPLFDEPGDEETVALAEALAGRFEPIDLAMALAKLHREKLPAAEDLDEYVLEPHRAEKLAREAEHKRGRSRDEDVPRRKPREYEPRREKPRREGKRAGEGFHAMEGSVWFRIGVGRERNADPKWLLPEICRQGEVTKKEIGEIRVFETETRFELAAGAADDFLAKITARKKGGVNITPAMGGEPEDGYLPPMTVSANETPAADAPRPAKKKKNKNKGKPDWHKPERTKRFEAEESPRAPSAPPPKKKKKDKAKKKQKRQKNWLTD